MYIFIYVIQFTKTRPNLSWIYYLKHHRYSEATVSAVDHSRIIPTVSRAKTLLSIAKLSSKLSNESTKLSKNGKFLRFSGEEKEEVIITTSASIKDSVNEMNRSLAIMHVQEKLQTLCPRLLFIFRYYYYYYYYCLYYFNLRVFNDLNIRVDISDLIS